MREVTLPQNSVQPDVVAQPDSGRVDDEAAPDVAAEQLRRPDFLVDGLPEPLALPRHVGALEHPWQPTDPAFGEHDLQIRMVVEHREKQRLIMHCIELRPISAMKVASGASGAVKGRVPEVPKCIISGMSASSAALKNGSQ